MKSLFTFFWGLAKYDTFSIIVGSERNGQIMGNVTEVKEKPYIDFINELNYCIVCFTSNTVVILII